MTYIEMVDILLGLLCVDRLGLVPPSFVHPRHDSLGFCYGQIQLCKYLPVYYAQMSRLHETCPGLHDHFLIGGFSVQLRNGNLFARIAVDQTTEEIVNNDTQTVDPLYCVEVLK